MVTKQCTVILTAAVSEDQPHEQIRSISYLHRGDYVFATVCLLVGWLVCLSVVLLGKL